jgi:hypothetical protein
MSALVAPIRPLCAGDHEDTTALYAITCYPDGVLALLRYDLERGGDYERVARAGCWEMLEAYTRQITGREGMVLSS